MARQHNKLNALAVKRASKPGLISDGNGLYLRVGKTGAKGWIFRYRRAGKLKDMGLGSLHEVSLSMARDKAIEARKLLGDGTDPLEHKRSQEAANAREAAQGTTFQVCAKAYVEAHKAGWKSPIHTKQWPNSIRDHCKPILNRPVGSVDTDDVLACIRPIWYTKTETASRVRGRIENILDYAKVRGMREGENPARWRGHLDKLLPAKSDVAKSTNYPALPYEDIAAFMSELRKKQTVSARALQLVILTACRTTEAIQARWEEFDIEKAEWTIPGPRMKTGKPHKVPISSQAMTLLDSQRDNCASSEWVFPGVKRGKPINHAALVVLLRRMGREDITVHGFRSTFRDWAAETTHHPHAVCEMALAHTISNQAEAAYRRVIYCRSADY